MKEIDIQLTYVDKIILNSYSQMLEGLSQYLGDGYEIVLHSLEDCSHSAIKVVNGFHTGRKEGAPITDLALSMLERIQNQNEASRAITYFARNKRGEPLKSATIAVEGENHRIIGLLCVNFYLNTSFVDFLNTFVKDDLDLVEMKTPVSMETFSSNSQELIEEMVKQVRMEVYEDFNISLQKKNKEVIQRLYTRGIYNMKDAVIKTAQILNMSKNTVYLHLRNLEIEPE